MHDFSWEAMNEMINQARSQGDGVYEFSLTAYDAEKDGHLEAEWRVTITIAPRRIIVDMTLVD